MDEELSVIISDILSIQSKTHKNRMKSMTDCRRLTLQYSTIASKIEAKREVMRREFDKRRSEIKQLYDSANQTMDFAIEKGDAELAQITMTVIKRMRELMNKGDYF